MNSAVKPHYSHFGNYNNFIYTKPMLLLSDTSCSTLKFALLSVRSISNESFILNNFICSATLGFIFLTETWLQPDAFLCQSLALLHMILFIAQAKRSGCGGSLLAVFNKCLNASKSLCPTIQVLTFKCVILALYVQYLFTYSLSPRCFQWHLGLSLITYAIQF